MVTLPPAANGLSVPVKEQVRVPLCVAWQPASAGAVTVQVPEGSVSVTTTLLAAPAPMLLTVIVKGALWPALRDSMSDVCSSALGQFTTMEAEAELLGPEV